MRDKTTKKVNKWPVTRATVLVSLLKFSGSSGKPITVQDTYVKISVCTPLNVENISSRRNSFGLGSHFCQQNVHISVKKMNFSNIAQVKYSIVASHLHLYLLLLGW